MGDSSERLRDGYAEMAAEAAAVQKAIAIGYDEAELAALPAEAVVSFGCGNPVGMAGLRPGEAVLDLGCGVGLDGLLAARQVGPTGKVIGIDMTGEMVGKASANARAAGLANVSFQVGEIEHLPLPDEAVDVVISNCALNHCPDRVAAFAEVRRVLRPGGRMVVSDLTVEADTPPELLAALDPMWAEWLKLAAGKQDYLKAITEAGLREVTILAEAVYDTPQLDERLRGKLASVYVRAVR
jgi:arsenite methyltransferase